MKYSFLEERVNYIKETTFGIWFQGTETWFKYVLQVALNDLERLMNHREDRYPIIFDVGCGHGRSFELLEEKFHPDRLVGLDIDPYMVQQAAATAQRCKCQVDIRAGNASRLDLQDGMFDMVFCHQTLHHIIDQENAIREFYRVLKPGGVLLFAESTRKYIHSLIIRLLFRHPMDVQKSSEEYLSLIQEAGFKFQPEGISLPYLWWSRPDLGILEKLGYPVPADREETLVNVVAFRPS
jgi:SAM-dependent methyltransferase